MSIHIRENKATKRFEIWMTQDHPDQKYRFRTEAFGTTPLPICSYCLNTTFESRQSAEKFANI